MQDFLETRRFYRGKKARHICPGPCASRKSITPVLRALQTVFEKSKQKPTVLQASRSSSILHVKTYLLYMITAYGILYRFVLSLLVVIIVSLY